MNFYIADGDQRRGPFPIEQLKDQGLRPDMLVWRDGLPEWQRADTLPELQPLFADPHATLPPPPPPMNHNGYPPNPAYPPVPPFNKSDVNSKKIAAGVLAIILGSFGIHKFILGMTTPGLIMLILTVATCGFAGIVMGVIGLIEGIIYLTKSDEEFYQRYIVEKQGWF